MLNLTFASFLMCILSLSARITHFELTVRNTQPAPCILLYYSQTATGQYSFLNTPSFLHLLSNSPCHLISKRNLVLYWLILLSGDVESNPGPRPASSIFNVCTFNIRSLTNHLHYTALTSLAQTHNVDIFALTETWISPNTTSAELFDSIPHGFYLVSTPRPVTSSKTSIVGGGTAFLVREPLSLLSSPTFTFKSFEVSTITLKLPQSKLTICNIYRPPPTSAVSRNKSTFSQFLEDFQCLVSTVTTLPHEFIITGDFNIHVDNPTDSYTQQFLSVLNDANLTQHVTFPTHSHSHTLDLVITGINSSLRPSITRINTSPSDHFPVLSTVNITPPPFTSSSVQGNLPFN
jgi:exonuclease III